MDAYLFTCVPHTLTDTALGAAEVFTSAWQRVKAYPLVTDAVVPIVHDRARLVGLVYSDAAGSLVVQSSLDGATIMWASAAMAYAGALATNGDFNFVIPGSFVRLVYTNGGVAQTVFWLGAWLMGVAQ